MKLNLFGSVSFASLVVTAALALTACGKDKTVEEYQRQKLQESLSIYESVSGTYTGLVTSNRTGKSMGALQLDLSAETATRNQSGGNTALGSPVLVTNVRFRDQSVINFAIPSSFYDPDSGAYSATISVDRMTGRETSDTATASADTVVIKGSLRNGEIIGTIGAVASPAGTATFRLSLNGPPLDQIRKGQPKGDLDTIGETRHYNGKGRMPGDADGKARDRKMVFNVNKPARGNAGQFVDVFYSESVKTLNVSIELSDAVSVSLVNVLWDPQNGTIDGTNERISTGGSYSAYIQCKNFFFTQQVEPFQCNYWSSRSPVIPMEFKP